MKILVIGKGGREHAIIRTIKQQNNVQIFCAPGNGGTAIDATNVDITEMEFDSIKKFTIKNKIDFVIVTPDNPLAEGLVDTLQQENIPCFGPTKSAAKIESSKVFAKNFMQKYKIPTAAFQIFDNANKAINYIKNKNKFPITIKADGLAFGKGVFIANTLNEAQTIVENMLIKKQFKTSSEKIVIEEFLQGTEVSILCFTDGKTLKPMVSCMDHKKAFDNNKGPNTGGMGAITPNFAYTKTIAKTCMKTIFQPTVTALNKENRPFSGCLYFGLMLTENGPKVIEYNCRFGDPETQAILPLLQTNLLEIMLRTHQQKLNETKIKFYDKTSACIILASKGYPNHFETGFKITGLNYSNGQMCQNSENIQIFHSGTKFQNNQFTTNSGRVLSLVSTHTSLKTAIKNAYDAAQLIDFKNKFYRTDIGASAIKLETISTKNL